MRNGPPPQPGNYLGDDPDLTAEVGQRLASTAQTTQGIITNYLFYGQRRSADRQLTDRHDRDAELGRERTMDETRSGTADAVSATVRTARRDVDRPPPPDAPAGESDVTDRQADEARLTFRVVGPDEAPHADKAAHLAANPRDTQHDPSEDPLAVDALADDPSQRDPLASLAGASDPERVTLSAEGPARGR